MGIRQREEHSLGFKAGVAKSDENNHIVGSTCGPWALELFREEHGCSCWEWGLWASRLPTESLSQSRVRAEVRRNLQGWPRPLGNGPSSWFAVHLSQLEREAAPESKRVTRILRAELGSGLGHS